MTVNITENSEILVSHASEDETKCLLRFSNVGSFIDDVFIDDVAIGSVDAHYQPLTGNFLVQQLTHLVMVSRSGTKIRSIVRQSDGQWLAYVERVSVAPSGEFAVLARHFDSNSSKLTAWVNLYAASGQPISTIRLPIVRPDGIDFDGKIVAVTYRGYVLFFDSAGDSIGRFAFPHPVGKDVWPQPKLIRSSTELLLIDGNDGTSIHRYAIPEL